MKNKNILITGGTGSFGNVFLSKVLKLKPKKVIIFSRDEMKQWEMKNKFKNFENIRFFVGDIRDKERLSRAIDQVDTVIHAAALKIVPTAEYNPMESIKTNIIGAMNLIDVCLDKGVKKVISLSTDKACNPINLYGATKLAADKLFIAGNYYSKNKTVFSIVRYGNVIGSRGSMVPFFIDQKKKNKNFTLTDKKMTRFITNLNDACDIVLKCEKTMVGGEIFVNKNPSIKIIDFLKILDPKRKIELIGLRPGEKINETLITNDESRFTYDFGKYYKIIPSIFPEQKKKLIRNFKKKMDEKFSYRSDNNVDWVSMSKIKDIIKSAEIYFNKNKF